MDLEVTISPLGHWHHSIGLAGAGIIKLARYHHYRQRAQAPEIIYNCSG